MAISKQLRHDVLRRERHACRYCRSTERPLEVDHVIPRALGGTDVFTNLTAACRLCNRSKSATVPDPALVREVRDEAIAWERDNERLTSSVLREARRPNTPLIATGDGRLLSEAQLRKDERYRLVHEASHLYADYVEFWTLLNVNRPVTHRMASPCISIPVFINCLLDNEILPDTRDEAVRNAADEPLWCELEYNVEDDHDPSYWSMPAEFCDRCCEPELVALNQVLPEWMLCGERTATGPA